MSRPGNREVRPGMIYDWKTMMEKVIVMSTPICTIFGTEYNWDNKQNKTYRFAYLMVGGGASGPPQNLDGPPKYYIAL